jgi:hypothetical protein
MMMIEVPGSCFFVEGDDLTNQMVVAIFARVP